MLGIIGSIAKDFVAVTPQSIFQTIAPKPDQIVSSPRFYAPSVHIKEGGTGANIAYAFGEAVKLMSNDKVSRAALFGACAIARYNKIQDTAHERPSVDYGFVMHSTKEDAQAIILTDCENEQINTFHPGAMEDSIHSNAHIAGPFSYAIVSPSSKDAMLDGIDKFHAAGAKVFFDPGQASGLFDEADLCNILNSGKVFGLFCNQAEILNILDKLHLNDAYELADRVKLIIVTKGADGVEFLWNAPNNQQGHLHVPAATVQRSLLVDPTGAGDAFRGGFFATALVWDSKLNNWWDWQEQGDERFVKCLVACAEQGAIMAKHCVMHDGPQGYVAKDPEVIREELWAAIEANPVVVDGADLK